MYPTPVQQTDLAHGPEDDEILVVFEKWKEAPATRKRLVCLIHNDDALRCFDDFSICRLNNNFRGLLGELRNTVGLSFL